MSVVVVPAQRAPFAKYIMLFIVNVSAVGAAAALSGPAASFVLLRVLFVALQATHGNPLRPAYPCLPTLETVLTPRYVAIRM